MSSDEIEEIKAELEAEWPNLAQTHYRITSKHTAEYNCLAWVVCEQDRWCSPIPEDEYYWPEGVSREQTLQAFTEAYQTCGYEVCDNGDVETGVEKIAIYATAQGLPCHAARQLSSGMWTSKLGRIEDIEHELYGLESQEYGTVKQFMKRIAIDTPHAYAKRRQSSFC